MPGTRRPYPPDFRTEAVRLARSGQHPIALELPATDWGYETTVTIVVHNKIYEVSKRGSAAVEEDVALVFVGNQIGAAGSTITVDPASGAIFANPVSGQNFTLTAGEFILGAATSRIVPGATSFSVRNHANVRDDLIIVNNQWGGGVGIGGAANGNNPLLLTGFDSAIVGGSAALSILGNGRGISISNNVNWSDVSDGHFYDTIDIYHKSAGDGVYVAHIGGLKPAGNTNTGADASFNTLIPYYRDDTRTGRAGTIVNTYTGMKGLVVDYQPTTSGTAVIITYAGSDQAVMLTNQNDIYPQGNGYAFWIKQYGTNTMMKIDHHGAGAGTTISATTFDVLAGRPFLKLKLNGEANQRFQITYDGTMQWGAGAVAPDASLGRGSSVSQLLIRNELELQQAAGNSASRIFSTYTAGDGAAAFVMTAVGTMQWGDRTAAVDTNLYRNGVGILKTDGQLQVGGTLTLSEAANIAIGTAIGTKIGTATTQKLGFWNATPIVQPTGTTATIINNVTPGGTPNTIANFTDLSVYANDAAAIRNDMYQLAAGQKIIVDALRAIGLMS